MTNEQMPRMWSRAKCFTRETFAGLLILLPEATDPVVLNASARIVWIMLDEPRTTSELRDELVEVFDIDLAVADEYVKSALDLLSENQILEPQP